jgi:transcriptional regulator with XRE-family HTH domain
VSKKGKLAPMTIGERITAHRIKKGLSRGQLGRLVNTSTVQISAYERGDQLPGLLIADKIAKTLDLPLQYLIDGEEMPPIEKIVPFAIKLPKSVQASIHKFIRDQILLVKHHEMSKQISKDLAKDLD